MALAFYMDHNVFRALTDGLRLRGIDVLTALEDGASEIPDPVLLDRATELGRVLFTHDDDLVKDAVRRQRAEDDFHGVIYIHQLRVRIGPCIEDLELIARVYAPEEIQNQVIFLPLS